jgi:membrane associated rhomboid family serine protease
MIFPILRGLVSPFLAPITYVLLFVNLLAFAVSYQSFNDADQAIDVLIEDNDFMNVQGLVFSNMIKQKPMLFTKTLQNLAVLGSDHDSESLQVLGSLALRDRLFMQHALHYQFSGDEIAIQSWRQKFSNLLQLQETHPSYHWGINSRHNTWQNWISYQFAHSGWSHLFWNMVFLMIFGTFIEIQLGGVAVLLGYLVGGVVGALSYSHLSGISFSPLVGASASVSGLMGIVVTAFFSHRLKFFYWLLPLKGYFGYAYLPAWLVIIVYILPDISGFFSSVPEFGSVAYSAHIGGLISGVLLVPIFSHLFIQFRKAKNVTPGYQAPICHL